MQKTITVLTLMMSKLISTTSLDADISTTTSNNFTSDRTTTYNDTRFRNGTEMLQGKGIHRVSHWNRIVEQSIQDRNVHLPLPVQETKYTLENYSNSKITNQGLGYIQNISMNSSIRLKYFKNKNVPIVVVSKDETIYNRTKHGYYFKGQRTDVQNQTVLMANLLRLNHTHIDNVTSSKTFHKNSPTIFKDGTIPKIDNSDVIDHVVGSSHNLVKRSAECPSVRQRELCPWRFTRIRKYGNEPLSHTIQGVSCLQTRVTGIGNSLLECHPKYGMRRVRLRNCDCRTGDCYRDMNITVGCVATLPCVVIGVTG